jgi:hypothetical protein
MIRKVMVLATACPMANLRRMFAARQSRREASGAIRASVSHAPAQAGQSALRQIPGRQHQCRDQCRLKQGGAGQHR